MKTIDDLNRLFVYEPDERDTWTILTDDSPKGDCDDYALTAAYLIAGKSKLRLVWNVLTLKTVLWYVTTEWGEPHMALWVRGSGWVCNIYRDFGELKHKKLYPVLFPLFLAGVIVK